MSTVKSKICAALVTDVIVTVLYACRTRFFYAEKAGCGRSGPEEANSCHNT